MTNKLHEMVIQINDNIKEIKKMYKEENKKLSRCDLVQQDLLHYIETKSVNDGFEAIEVLKMLHDNRQERRAVKNDVKNLERMVKLINNNKLESKTNKLVKVINGNNHENTYKVKVLTDVLGEYV